MSLFQRRIIRFSCVWCFRWAISSGLSSVNPAEHIKIKTERYLAEFYSVEVIEKLFGELKGEFSCLLVFAGLRPSEGKRVEWKHVNFDTGELHVIRGKKEER